MGWIKTLLRDWLLLLDDSGNIVKKCGIQPPNPPPPPKAQSAPPAPPPREPVTEKHPERNDITLCSFCGRTLHLNEPEKFEEYNGMTLCLYVAEHGKPPYTFLTTCYERGVFQPFGGCIGGLDKLYDEEMRTLGK